MPFLTRRGAARLRSAWFAAGVASCTAGLASAAPPTLDQMISLKRPSTPAVSPDGQILYYIDTLGKTIHAADIASDGSLTNRRLFATIAEDEGYPDGPTIDSEGYLWVSLYGGWETRRYSAQGEIVQRVRLPAPNIT